MPDTPDHRDLWHELNQARLDIAELRGMLSMHFSDRKSTRLNSSHKTESRMPSSA